jgi:hypothetical protein
MVQLHDRRGTTIRDDDIEPPPAQELPYRARNSRLVIDEQH